MKCDLSFKLHCKIRSIFISAFLIHNCIFNIMRVYTNDKTSRTKQITPVRDNFYRILKSSKNSGSFENLFKFKIIKMAVTDNSIL